MTLAIMQPYFLPYIGYFQLINMADVFVVYDNIKYTKKGWINRNRFLRNGGEATFTIPVAKNSDYLDIRDRSLAGDYDRNKLLNQFKEAYRRAPEFAAVFSVLEDIIMHQDNNLFGYIHNSIKVLCARLSIETDIIKSSDCDIDHDLHGEERVIALCKAFGADTYINPIGGLQLYTGERFSDHGVQLSFLKTRPVTYHQPAGTFIPWLSIIDVMMNNPAEALAQILTECDVLDGSTNVPNAKLA